MASSRPTSSPEAELRHWLQDLLIEGTLEETGRELKKTSAYSLIEVTVGGGLPGVAVRANETALHLREDDEEYTYITAKVAEECHRYTKLRHPNILQFLGVCFPKACILPMVITEKLDFTLTQCLHRFANLPDTLKVSLLLDIALGLQCLHDQSPAVPHRDLTASNIFLTSSFQAKLTYPAIYQMFGDQSEEDETHNRSSAFTGIATSDSGNCKDDILAYGQLMVHVITQRRSKRSISTHAPSLLQQIEHVDSSHALRGLIMQCLQKDPVLRPTAGEIVLEVNITSMSQKSSFHDPIKVLSAMLNQPMKGGNSPNKSPTESKLKRLEMDNNRLTAQLKVTQSELRHLRMQQTIFGQRSMSIEEEEDEEEVELKDASVQVDILQVNHQKVYIELHKENSELSLGFSIAGGKGVSSTYQEGDHGVYITRIAPGGPAETDGRLKTGDKLISVNGEDMSRVTRAEALTALLNTTDVCVMVVSREEISTEMDSSLPSRRFSSTRRRPSKNKLHPLKLGVTVACEQCTTLPDPLTDSQAVIYKNCVIVGGQYSENCGIIYEYNPETDTWNVIATSPVWFYALAVFQDKITVVGGFDPNAQNCSDKLFAWNEREGSWMGSLPPMPTARMHSSAVSLGSSLVVAGGRNNKTSLNCIEVFSFASQQWYTAHPLLLEQSSMKSVCLNGLWYLMGGEQQGFASSRAIQTPLQSLIDSSLHKLGSVSCFRVIPSLPNTYSAVTILGGKIILIGGTYHDSTTSDKIYALSEDPMLWLEVGELPIPLTHGCAVAISDQETLIIGGRGEDGNDINDVYRIYLQEGCRQEGSR